MKRIIIPSIIAACMLSCTGDSVDGKADFMLTQARQALAHHNYRAARDTILAMRKRYPTAIEARRKGILLLDSIEMWAAQDSLAKSTGEEWKRLQLKQQFFERKLSEDKKKDNR